MANQSNKALVMGRRGFLAAMGSGLLWFALPQRPQPKTAYGSGSYGGKATHRSHIAHVPVPYGGRREPRPSKVSVLA